MNIKGDQGLTSQSEPRTQQRMAANALVTNTYNHDGKYVAKERAARNALQQAKIQYDREMKVIIAVVIY